MNDVRLDPEAVRGFGDDVWGELETNIRPWIAEIVAGLGTETFKNAADDFGHRGVAYGAPKLDAVHGNGVADLRRWLRDLSIGMEALALGSAVMAEQLSGTDIDSAVMVDKKAAVNDDRGMAV